MNIKNLLGNTIPIASTSGVNKADRPIKMESAADRDPSGQSYSQQERKKEKMTDEQFEKAIAILKEKHFVKDMNWVVEAVTENDLKYAWVKDSSGNTIRKISELDLWEVFDDVKFESPKGQLLKRSA